MSSKNCKEFLKDSNDPYLNLLTYKATPLPWCGLFPAKLLMGKKLEPQCRSKHRILLRNVQIYKSFEKMTASKKRSRSAIMTNFTEHMTCQNSVMTLLFSYILVEVRPLNFQVAETVRLKEDFPFQYPHATTT